MSVGFAEGLTEHCAGVAEWMRVWQRLPVRAGWRQLGKLRCARRPADPWPKNLTHSPQTQMLASLHEIDHGAVVVFIPQREENVMTIAIALHDDLIGGIPQHRAPSPTLAPVDLIAEALGKLPQIDVSFESIEFTILVDHRDIFLPYCPFSLGT